MWRSASVGPNCGLFPAGRASGAVLARGGWRHETCSALFGVGSRDREPQAGAAPAVLRRGQLQHGASAGRIYQPKQRRVTLSGISRTTTDHETIRHWAEARGGQPARVSGTQEHSAGLLRIQFADAGEDNALEGISWEEFFEKFDEKALAFAYQEATSDGQISRFNRLVSRGH